MPSLRLAITDLDSTLLSPNKEVSNANLEALHCLREAGLEVVMASGRHHTNMKAIGTRIGLEGWIISAQGALVKHSLTEEMLYEAVMPVELSLEVYAEARKRNMSLIAYHRSGVYIETETEWTQLYARRSGHVPMLTDLRELAHGGLQKLIWKTSPEQITETRPHVEALFGQRLYVVQTERDALEFLSLEANKGRGAQVVAQKLGVSAEQVVTFGDGDNDAPMLRWSGVSVAMPHGTEAARKAAKRIGPAGSREDAFARAVDLVLRGA